MAMKIHEIHPAVVHLPITLLPAALLADAVGALRDDKSLLKVGRWGIVAAAGSALLSGLTGLIAQEEVKTNAHAKKMLVTHRNLNVGLTTVAAGMAIARQRTERPSLGYLALGAAGVGLMTYTAYIGSHMVYSHGVGVEAADGLREDTPGIPDEEASTVVRRSLRDIPHGVAHAAQDISHGDVAPLLQDRAREMAARAQRPG